MSEPSEDLHKLVRVAELQAVSYLELSASRSDESRWPTDGVPLEVSPVINLNLLAGDAGFQIVLDVMITMALGNLGCKARATYGVSDPSTVPVSEDLMLEFTNHVGAMALIPFIRQTLADLSTRVFEAPLLIPLLGRGELWFTRTGTDPAS